jgi:aminopeptidase
LIRDERVGAKTILDTCLGVKRGENILVAYDEMGKKNAYILINEAQNSNYSTTGFEITADDENEKPAKKLADLMSEKDISILCVNQKRIVSYGHSDARITAVRAGRRVAFLTQDISLTPSPSDILKIDSKSKKLGALLERTTSITILTGNDCELRLEVRGRKSFPLSSVLTKAGDWGALPDYAEAAIAPLEEDSEGDIEVDGAIMGFGALKKPARLSFMKGKLVEIQAEQYESELKRRLEKNGENAKILCELGLGANHLRTEIKGEFDDKKMLGSAHIAIGDNHTIGGRNVTKIHIDFLCAKPKILFDGEPVDL